MKRRDFFVRMGGAALAVPAALHLGACSLFGGDDDNSEPDAAPDAPPQAACEDGTNVDIGTNHGHTLEVTYADIQAGVEKTYDIQGTSAHPHTVTLTPAHYQALLDGQTVTITSSNDAAHDHVVMIVCV